MKIDVLTLFPEMFEGFLKNSIIKRAIEKEKVEIVIHDFRLFSNEKHHKVDDTVYGGGSGMLIKCQPVIDCIKSIEDYNNSYKIITSAQGNVYNQKKAYELSKKSHLIIVCGHYEGIDNRVLNYIDEEISIGDYILTGGEVASLAIIDSVVRLIDNVITKSSTIEESFSENLLEYPQFTKPAVFDFLEVPFVLTNGNHEEIRKYRRFESLKKTYQKRPDLLKSFNFSKEDEQFMKAIKEGITHYEDIK